MTSPKRSRTGTGSDAACADAVCASLCTTSSAAGAVFYSQANQGSHLFCDSRLSGRRFAGDFAFALNKFRCVLCQSRTCSQALRGNNRAGTCFVAADTVGSSAPTTRGVCAEVETNTSATARSNTSVASLSSLSSAPGSSPAEQQHESALTTVWLPTVPTT